MTPRFPLIMKGLFLIGHFIPQGFHLRAELVHHLLQVLDGGQLLPHGCRKLSGHVIGRNPDRLIDGLQSEFHDGTAPALAQENSDARPFHWGSHRAVHCRKVSTTANRFMPGEVLRADAHHVLEALRQMRRAPSGTAISWICQNRGGTGVQSELVGFRNAKSPRGLNSPSARS